MDKVGDSVLELVHQLSRISTGGEAKVRVNENICTPEEFKTVLDHYRKGTILEHIDIDVEGYQPYAECSCGKKENIAGGANYSKCEDCGKFVEVRNHPYKLEEPDPSVVGERKNMRF